MDFTSRYARQSDRVEEVDGWPMSQEEWSRKAEYPWAAQFARPNTIVIDAACGFGHKFKYHLAKHGRICYAIDCDKRILTEKLPAPSRLVVSNINNTPALTASIDTLFCISVLEHVHPKEEHRKVLKEFARVLKPGGLAVLTVDVDTEVFTDSVSLEQYLEAIKLSDFEFAGSVDTVKPADLLIEPNHIKRCVFLSVLRRK